MTPQVLDYFLPSLSLVSGILTTPKGWTTPHYDVLKRHLDEHLARGRSIGLRAAEKINFLMVDIDTHADKPTPEQLELRQTRIELLENNFPGLLFRSSNNNNGIGRHYYIPLSEYTETEAARRSLRNILISIGYPGADNESEVEIYPSHSRGFRLPFGAGNRPMPAGNDDLAESTLAELVNYFYEWLTIEAMPYNVIELLSYDIIPLLDQAAVTTPLRAKKTQPQASAKAIEIREPLTGDNFFNDPVMGINTLLNKGITSPGMRYKACNMVVYYFIEILGMAKDQAEHKTISWLDAKNNGLSNGYNESQAKAHNVIRAIIRNYDTTKLGTHKDAPGSRTRGVQFADDTQRHFIQIIQGIAIKAGQDVEGTDDKMIPLGYNLFSSLAKRFSNRNTTSKCFKWAVSCGLIIKKREGIPGKKAAVYLVRSQVIYGRHKKRRYDQRQALEILIAEHGSQKAVADLLEVTPAMISMLLNGKKEIPSKWDINALLPLEKRVNQIDTLYNSLCVVVPSSKREQEKEISYNHVFNTRESGSNPPGVVKQPIYCESDI